jgi:WG repeat protein
MSEKHDLLILPNQRDSSMVLSETRSSLAARGRKDAADLKVAYKESLCLAAVKLDGKWGFIQKDSSFAVEPAYAWVSPYSNGLAWYSFSGQTERYGHFISYVPGLDGERFEFAYGLRYFSPAPHNEALGLMDREGKVVMKPTFHCAGPFRQGLARVATKEEAGTGFIDRDGRFEIEPQFDEATDFDENKSIVALGDRYGLVGPDGRFIVQPTLDYLWNFSEGLARTKAGGKYGFVDNAGHFVAGPAFDDALDFSEGLAAVKVEQNWGYIDRSGKFAIEPIFYTADCFSGGIAEVDDWDSNDPFFITKSGNKSSTDAGAVRLDGQSELHEGLTKIQKQGLWGFTDSDGKLVIEPRFRSVGDFSNGFARASDLKGLWGYIDRAGNEVIPMRFEDAEDFNLVD